MIQNNKTTAGDQTSSRIELSLRTNQDTNKKKRLPSSLVMRENPFWDFVFVAKINFIVHFSFFFLGICSSGHIARAQLAASLEAAGGEK